MKKTYDYWCSSSFHFLLPNIIIVIIITIIIIIIIICIFNATMCQFSVFSRLLDFLLSWVQAMLTEALALVQVGVAFFAHSPPKPYTL